MQAVWQVTASRQLASSVFHLLLWISQCHLRLQQGLYLNLIWSIHMSQQHSLLSAPFSCISHPFPKLSASSFIQIQSLYANFPVFDSSLLYVTWNDMKASSKCPVTSRYHCLISNGNSCNTGLSQCNSL